MKRWPTQNSSRSKSLSRRNCVNFKIWKFLIWKNIVKLTQNMEISRRVSTSNLPQSHNYSSCTKPFLVSKLCRILENCKPKRRLFSRKNSGCVFRSRENIAAKLDCRVATWRSQTWRKSFASWTFRKLARKVPRKKLRGIIEFLPYFETLFTNTKLDALTDLDVQLVGWTLRRAWWAEIENYRRFRVILDVRFVSLERFTHKNYLCRRISQLFWKYSQLFLKIFSAIMKIFSAFVCLLLCSVFKFSSQFLLNLFTFSQHLEFPQLFFVFFFNFYLNILSFNSTFWFLSNFYQKIILALLAFSCLSSVFMCVKGSEIALNYVQEITEHDMK